jgi:hypothetical protein
MVGPAVLIIIVVSAVHKDPSSWHVDLIRDLGPTLLD